MSIESSHFLGFHWQDIIATLWLVVCWVGYSIFSKYRARHTFCISSILHRLRKQWMEFMLQRDNRIADVSLLANLERNSSFLASTAILMIAGLVTALASVDKVYLVLSEMPFSQANVTPLQLQFKIVILLLIYTYSFFTFTWAMRQYGFCAVLLGAAPLSFNPKEQSKSGRNFIESTAKVIDQAGHSYNYGLRAYYFSLAVLSWLISAWLFMFSVTAVVLVLYLREFHSKTLRAMVMAGDFSPNEVERKSKKTVG